MTTYFDHNAPTPSWQLVDCEPVMVSEAVTAEDRAAFAWAWQRACRERGWEAYAALVLEGAQ